MRQMKIYKLDLSNFFISYKGVKKLKAFWEKAKER